MLWKIHCCAYSLLSGFSPAQPITSQTPNGGEMPAYWQASGHSTPLRWEVGLEIACSQMQSIFMIDNNPSEGSSQAACMSLHRELRRNRKDRQEAGKSQNRVAPNTPHPFWIYTVYLPLSQSPIQSFFHTKKPVNNVHSHNKQLCSLQVMHRESHQEFLTQCSLVPSLSKESAQILVSAQNAALEAGALDLSHTTEHSTLQSWRDWLGSWPFGPPSWLLASPLGLHSEEQQWALPVAAVLCRVSWGFVEGMLNLNLIFTRLWALHPASLCQARCTHSKIMAAAVTQQTRERKSHGVGLRRGVCPLRCRRATRQGGSSIYFRMIIRMQGSGKWKLHIFH